MGTSGPSRRHLCFSGLTRAEKDQATGWAGALGFEVHGDLTDHCTQVVADSVCSEKARAAVRMRIPVVSLAWLDESQRRRRPEPERPYLLPPLHKLVIVLTGTSFHTERRAELARAVREAGGALHKELTEECTHLVVADDLETSRKVDACKTHESLQRVHVVSASWLDTCVRGGVCADEQPFLLLRRPPPRVVELRDPDLFLAPCVLYIPPAACADGEHDALVAAARASGATRTPAFGAHVTHVVLGERAARTGPDGGSGGGERGGGGWASLRTVVPGVLLVRARWLLDCAARKLALPTDADYAWTPPKEKENERPGAGKARAPPAPAPAPAPAPPPSARGGGRGHHGHHGAGSSNEASQEPHASAAPRPAGDEGRSFSNVCLLCVDGRRAGGAGAAHADDERLERLLRAAEETHHARVLRGAGAAALDEWVGHRGHACVVAPHGEAGARAASEALRARTRAGGGGTQEAVTLDWLEWSLSFSKAEYTAVHPLFAPLAYALPLPSFGGLRFAFTEYTGKERVLAERLVRRPLLLKPGARGRARPAPAHPSAHALRSPPLR